MAKEGCSAWHGVGTLSCAVTGARHPMAYYQPGDSGAEDHGHGGYHDEQHQSVQHGADEQELPDPGVQGQGESSETAFETPVRKASRKPKSGSGKVPPRREKYRGHETEARPLPSAQAKWCGRYPLPVTMAAYL